MNVNDGAGDADPGSAGVLSMNLNITRLRANQFLLLIGLGFLAITSRAEGLRKLLVPADGRGPSIFGATLDPCAMPSGPIQVGSGEFFCKNLPSQK